MKVVRYKVILYLRATNVNEVIESVGLWITEGHHNTNDYTTKKGDKEE